MEIEESLANRMTSNRMNRQRMLLKASFGVALGGALAAVGLGETSSERKLRGDWETCRERCDCESGI